MNACRKCGMQLNESSGFCINCSSRAAKAYNKKEAKRKKLVVGVRLILSILLVLCIVILIIKEFNKHEPIANVAVTKTKDQSSVMNKGKSDKAGISTEENSKASLKPEPFQADYILPDSNKKVLREADLATLTKEQLRLARNEIYARHGYVFRSDDLQKYFLRKSWYKADTTYNGSLNKVELENVKLLKAREEQHK